MREHYINQANNMIAGWYLDDLSVCDELIAMHKETPDKTQGQWAGNNDAKIKDSTDVILPDGDLARKYMRMVMDVTRLYVEKYPEAKVAPFAIIEPINIQHYQPPSQAFHQWHSERAGCVYPFSHRHLVFMTYLNDVTDAGETEWLYQKVKIKPEKGLTVIWPAEWVFTHRGVPSPTQEKYITTGWFTFIIPDNLK